jgi:hypothetical protein
VGRYVMVRVMDLVAADSDIVRDLMRDVIARYYTKT